MGTNKTEHYGLHQWVPEDDFLRTDFNENFEKLDLALYTAEQNLRTDLTGDVQQLNTALDTLERELRADHDADITQVESALSKAQQTLQNNLNTQVTRLDTALSTAQQTLRSEFNSSIQQVNTTLASVQALAEGRANIVFGTYTGDGRSSTTVNLGFAAKWIMLFAANGNTDNGYGGLAAVDYPIYSSSRGNHLEIVGNFIRIACDAVHGPLTNLSGQVYYYLAAR